MPAALLDTNLLSWPFLVGSFVVGFLVLALLIVGSWGRLLRWRRWIRRLVILTFAGLIVGGIIGWLISDVWNSFGVELSTPTRFWICGTMASLGAAAANMWSTRWWSKVVAIAAVPALILAGCLGINADLGEFRTFGDVVLGSQIGPLTLPTLTPPGHEKTPRSASWVAPKGMPSNGRVGTVAIPGTVSKFPARSAVVYLPPAALVQEPPSLPVLIVLSGQPGKPSDILDKAGFAATLDAFALAHNGLAPIVVIPDQLGASNANPMCVDSPLGNSETYLTVDVPSWIRHHLPVSSDRVNWAIAGFSQGGTCAIQLGAGHPELFGSLLDISGQVAPHNGSLAATIDRGFGGSAQRYSDASPLPTLAAHAPYVDTTAIFAVGQNDTRFAPVQSIVSNAARTAGMTVIAFEVPGTAHDWRCVTAALDRGLQLLGSRFDWGT